MSYLIKTRFDMESEEPVTEEQAVKIDRAIHLMALELGFDVMQLDVQQAGKIEDEAAP